MSEGNRNGSGISGYFRQHSTGQSESNEGFASVHTCGWQITAVTVGVGNKVQKKKEEAYVCGHIHYNKHGL